MNTEKELDIFCELMKTSIKNTIEIGKFTSVSTFELVAYFLESCIIHELITGENLLKEPAQVIEFKPTLVPPPDLL